MTHFDSKYELAAIPLVLFVVALSITEVVEGTKVLGDRWLVLVLLSGVIMWLGPKAWKEISVLYKKFDV